MIKKVLLIGFAILGFTICQAQSRADMVKLKADSLLRALEKDSNLNSFSTTGKRRKVKMRNNIAGGQFNFHYKAKVKHNGQRVERLKLSPVLHNDGTRLTGMLMHRRNGNYEYIRLMHYELTSNSGRRLVLTEYLLFGTHYVTGFSEFIKDAELKFLP